MREIIAICRSRKRARTRVATVLDRYFWRIGDRTWRGQASNACLDRVSKELRKLATRNTAVTIHEIRSANESRTPIIRIGSSLAFSAEGLAPVATHGQSRARMNQLKSLDSACAVVRIAALFHDLGKATLLFNNKLHAALNGSRPQADAIRHELFSAAVWHKLTLDTDDESLVAALGKLTPETIDHACEHVVRDLRTWHTNPTDVHILSSLTKNSDSLTSQIGLLILSHHRLPNSNDTFTELRLSEHINFNALLTAEDLTIASGIPFWHEQWWLSCLQREAVKLKTHAKGPWLELSMRASLMFADHVGSAQKTVSTTCPEHLANTITIEGEVRPKAADSLSRHTKRVYEGSHGAFEMMHQYRGSYPSLEEERMPVDLIRPSTDLERFQWQIFSARAARELTSKEEGGFFGCIIAGTGTGKTRGAPALLANAVFGDKVIERRSFRMTLGLGLRVLANQSGNDYVQDLGFSRDDVSIVIGESPINFVDDSEPNLDGSESHFTLPEWIRVERASTQIPEEGSEEEEGWLRGLSLNTSHRLPMFCDLAIKHSNRQSAFERLVASPILVGTIDHLMAVAAPARSRYLPQAIRVVSSDLILDEIDQYDPEDLAVLNRLVYQTGAAGRRVIIMSATLTEDIAETFFAAYREGWRVYAAYFDVADQVNLLCTGDAPDSVFVKPCAEDIKETFSNCRAEVLSQLAGAPALRQGRILPVCDSWQNLVSQIDDACSELHDVHAVTIQNFRVSVGLVRMTRIAHTAALTVQLPAGASNGRLRLKLCLHSNFPRLHRSWIEQILRNALNRKGPDPSEGIEKLFQRFDVFRRAEDLNIRDVELVVVASPVIETGSDLDFDWAIIDPVSCRSVVQSSGRTRRHRYDLPQGPNVFVLGCSPIVLETGRLAMPGVETQPHSDTRVAGESLDFCKTRNTRELFGDELLDTVNASFLLDQNGSVPLRDAETRLRKHMTSLSNCENAPGAYLTNSFARLSVELIRQRRFRRTVTRNIEILQIGDCIEDAQWFIDLAPATRESALLEACEHDLQVKSEPFANFLTENYTTQAWRETADGERELGGENLKRMMRTILPDYSRSGQKNIVPKFFYAEETGFTNGFEDDLLYGFGKIH